MDGRVAIDEGDVSYITHVWYGGFDDRPRGWLVEDINLDDLVSALNEHDFEFSSFQSFKLMAYDDYNSIARRETNNYPVPLNWEVTQIDPEEVPPGGRQETVVTGYAFVNKTGFHPYTKRLEVTLRDIHIKSVKSPKHGIRWAFKKTGYSMGLEEAQQAVDKFKEVLKAVYGDESGIFDYRENIEEKVTEEGFPPKPWVAKAG